MIRSHKVRLLSPGAILLVLPWLALTSGCQEESAAPQAVAGGSARREEQPDPRASLERATDFLERLDEFEPSQVDGQIIYHLNRWIDAVDTDVDWKPDPLIDELSAELRQRSALADIRKPKFQLSDVPALKEALWMKQVSNELAGKSQPGLVVWSSSMDADLSDSKGRLLQEATGLFDWTVRNVQLDPLMDEASQAAGESGEPDRSDISPARRTIPGPGYTAQPWQVMLYGHGDAWQRARVFIQLARQQSLDSVMLGLPKTAGSKTIQPWLPAVLIDGELYLFDTELGLPIPGPEGEGIATLAQVRANPELLKSLAVGGTFPYRVSAEDLNEVVALIDASPELLSRRMAILEERLTGKNQLMLTAKPAELASRLRQKNDLQRVSLWTVPIEADMFRSAVLRRLAGDDYFQAMYMQRFGLFEGLHPLVQGRQRYFRGGDGEDGQSSATAMYMDCRLPDEAIRDMATSRAAQQRMGLDPNSLPPELFQQRVQGAQIIATQAKANATYWIGFVHYAAGNYRVAADWFERSAKANENGGPWSTGASYNLARSYEALGRWEDARKIYLQSESPQRHGNLLRARMIAQQHSL